ncbi:hypothetical protein A5844_001470 [Enterococcus sp. 10A9_DIV0425]|uniref:Uncharacterized protein n=1 Tax=Candidatus Enterococcus wittei TaxID=1987383 RepID=A0A242K180_9ENTE|nr:hypothetical protein [Enterococcus sp. 10A9_DIV0425]OTP11335.1 hypothetical protein A5844_001470 [Enterococcus sp. 10A9_DIV0425]
MKLIKIAKILAVISGLILYFIMSVNQFFLYFEMFALLILNGIRIFEQRKNVVMPNCSKQQISLKVKHAKH